MCLFTNRNHSCQKLFPVGREDLFSSETKKADVAEHPKAVQHVGLLFAKPPRLCRVVFHLVIRLLTSLNDYTGRNGADTLPVGFSLLI
jgi:hypothetical protein